MLLVDDYGYDDIRDFSVNTTISNGNNSYEKTSYSIRGKLSNMGCSRNERLSKWYLLEN